MVITKANLATFPVDSNATGKDSDAVIDPSFLNQGGVDQLWMILPRTMRVVN